MKRLALVLVVLVIAWSLVGCGSSAVESDFMAEFSLGSILEANKQFLSTTEIASGGTLSGPTQPFFRRSEEAIVQIEPSDIPAFMQALQADIEHSLTGHGFRIVGGGSSRQGPGVSPTDIVEFDLRYGNRQTDGIVNVWGVRGQGKSLIVIALITEGPRT